MHLIKRTLLTTMVFGLAACGGGSSESAPPPVFEVKASESQIEMVDGEAMTIGLSVNNTTGEQVVALYPSSGQASPTFSDPVSFNFEANKLTISAAEIDSVTAEQVFHQTLTFEAGDMTSEITIEVTVINDELEDFLRYREELAALRNSINPFREVQAVTWRYMLQANLIGDVSDSAFHDYQVESAVARESYYDIALEATDSANKKYSSHIPHTGPAGAFERKPTVLNPVAPSKP